MPLTQKIVSRLAFIRFLHHQGVQQSRLPDPQSSSAVMTLHDAVEAFLLLAGEHVGCPGSREFERYWDALSPAKCADGVDLAGKQGMTRLNRVRIALKHHGAHPNTATINQIVEDTATFFAANTQIVFGVDYAQVSMADVIEQEMVRELVRVAEAAAGEGSFTGAMVALSDAYDLLLTPRRSDQREVSPLRFGDNLRHRSSFDDLVRVLQGPRRERGVSADAQRPRAVARQLHQVTEIVTQLQAAARITALGLDYAAYLRFASLTPHHIDFFGGQRKYRAPKGYAPGAEDVEFCHQFVVTVSLRLTEAHAHLTPPPWLTPNATAAWMREWETLDVGAMPSEGYL
ncbi:hypothetical protein GCM10010123_23060 [Pilimelia anulata]|uniref:Uncharacterized protein n=1 Tax=Pilimelia anulata TaxID=53371 RepID=A0A8J3F9F5_9ACTN|nr:hypothetical protein [Pilimelia anulata]GGJ92555.1 hypothetical protein GCM10010123_23060 [Pilimelia anulata]